MSRDIDPIDIEAKRKAKEAAQRQLDEFKAKKKRQRQCFWTKPYGHVYEWKFEPGYRLRSGQMRCVGCGKREPS